MSDEIEALLEQVEAECSTLQARLDARAHDSAGAIARAKEERTRLRVRLATMEPELKFTTEYVAALERQAMPPSPRRFRLQGLHLLVRAVLLGAAGAGAAMLHEAGAPDLAVAAAVALPALAVWIGGDICDGLEIRHG